MPPKSAPTSTNSVPLAPKRTRPTSDDEENFDFDFDEKPKKKARTTSKPKKTAKLVGTCSMTKQTIGDAVKSALRLEKYNVPRMYFDMQMDTTFFRAFFAANDALSSPLTIVPATFDETTPLVVTELNNREAGELLGVSKVKGGNRMETTYLRGMCAVFYPPEQKCKVWLTV